jgi:hypothetical protein
MAVTRFLSIRTSMMMMKKAIVVCSDDEANEYKPSVSTRIRIIIVLSSEENMENMGRAQVDKIEKAQVDNKIIVNVA